MLIKLLLLLFRKILSEKYNAGGGSYKALGQKKTTLIGCFCPKLVSYYKH